MESFVTSSSLRITTENTGILDQNHIIRIYRVKKQLLLCHWARDRAPDHGISSDHVTTTAHLALGML